MIQEGAKVWRVSKRVQAGSNEDDILSAWMALLLFYPSENNILLSTHIIYYCNLITLFQ